MTPFISYAESSFDFRDGTPVFAFHHIARREDHLRLTRIMDNCRRTFERREGRVSR